MTTARIARLGGAIGSVRLAHRQVDGAIGAPEGEEVDHGQYDAKYARGT